MSSGLKQAENLSAKLAKMRAELDTILSLLDEMGVELVALLNQVKSQVDILVTEIELLTGSINVHERTKEMADEVLYNLKQIFNQARQLHPASEAFKDDLQLMAKRYTMEES